MKPANKPSPFYASCRCWVGYFHDPVYNFTVHLLWDVDSKKLQEYANLNFPKEPIEIGKDDWMGRCIEFTSNSTEVQLIAMREFKGTPDDHSVLAHECMHVVQNVLGPRGMELTDTSVEAYCYLIDSLVRRCLEEMSKAKRKTR